MTRIPELLPLSQAHYHALKLALDAKRAVLAGDAQVIATTSEAVREHMAAELDPHFRVEENLLLPAMRAAGFGDLVDRILVEHRLMRELVEALAAPSLATLRGFADLLESHVRFEEQELFDAARACLDPATLAALAGH